MLYAGGVLCAGAGVGCVRVGCCVRVIGEAQQGIRPNAAVSSSALTTKAAPEGFGFRGGFDFWGGGKQGGGLTYQCSKVEKVGYPGTGLLEVLDHDSDGEFHQQPDT